MTDFWVVLLDPKSCQLYTENLRTQEIHIEEWVPPAIQELAKCKFTKFYYLLETVQRINSVVKLNGMNWWSDHEQLNRYRRRRIPHYFINKVAKIIKNHIIKINKIK